MRQSWTDERLDDFKDQVDQRFEETNQRMEAGFARLDGRLDELNRTLHQYAIVMLGAFATLIVGLLGVLVAQT